jgi:Protein of unknown function (DUF1501)
MLTFYDQSSDINRRNFLRVGSLGLGGLTLSNLLQAEKAQAGSGQKNFLKDKSVIFLFMHGGPSQFETFDPKMSAPVEIRSMTGGISTAVPGMDFGGGMPRLAKLADKISVVRSFTTGNGNHDIKPIVCKETLNANMGSLYSRVTGAINPATGIPRNVTLYPRAVDASTMKAFTQFGNHASAGSLGGNYAAFVPGVGGNLQSDMQLNLPLNRFNDRKHLLEKLDRAKRFFDTSGVAEGLGDVQQQAYNAILGKASTIFDLTKEDDLTLARYDTKAMSRIDQFDKKLKNYKRYVDNGKSLGKLLLMARRLCEAGCGFVTVTTNFVWDMHADVNNAGMVEGMKYVGAPFDHAVAAFLEDVESRGLSDKILLVATGEMGRDPRINPNGGRNHWGRLAPLMFAGGGLKMGQVIGQSNSIGAEPSSSPIKIEDLIATVMSTIVNVGELRLERGVPDNVMKAISQGRPIEGLV